MTVHILPFLTLENYDQLLWACDVNFVRGEESWVRAIWAAKPFIWQPYLQVDNAHLMKLNAFLKFFYEDFITSQSISALHQSWSVEEFYGCFWEEYISNLSQIEAFTKEQSDMLMQQPSLVPRLLALCKKIAN